MKARVFSVLLAFLILGTALPISAQVCGDLTGDNSVSISDMIRLMDWIVGYGPAPQNPGLGDVDDRVGVTYADITRLDWYFFSYFPDTYDCSPTQTYSYTSSPDDTLFIPRFMGVPADQDVINLPILTNLRADTKGLVFYTQFSTDDLFDLTWIELTPGGIETFATYNGDTLSGAVTRQDENHNIDGPRQPITITFTRTNPGVGNIEFFPIDRTSTWRLGVVKENYDILIPTIVTIDFTDNNLRVAPTEVQFESVFGFPSPVLTETLELTDVSAPIDWTASSDQTWLQIDQEFGTTPASIQVTVDPTGLGSGIHAGTITIENVSFPYAAPIEVPVTMTVRAPFPSMDANCDGKFNISDMTYIIDYLFGIPRGPAPCDPCTGTFPGE